MSSEKYAGGAREGGKRLALVVGVNNVPKSLLPPLQSACQDAEAIAHVLETHCHFTLLEPPLLEKQATSAAIKKAVLDLIEHGEAHDFLLFYFSGHGQPIDVEAGRNEIYLGTYDFVEKHVERDETLHLSLSWLRDKLFQRAEAEKVLLVFDCCYSGAVVRSGPDPYLEELQQRISYYFGRPGATIGAPSGGLRKALTAAGHNQPAQEGHTHGRMTEFLLPALRGEVPEALTPTKRLSLSSLDAYLKESYEPPPKPALSGDDAGKDCILATFAAGQSGLMLPKAVSTDRPANYLPFLRDPYFQPRPGEFAQLERLLFVEGSRQSTALGLVGVTGMGGVGKTRLAVELAYRYQQRFFGGIFWMAATGQTLFDWQRTLADLAVKTNFLPPEDDPTNPEHVVLRARHLCRYFASHADVLVILDNVEVPQLVTTALADLAGGELACTILYTSRQRTPLTGVALYSVEVLTEEGALHVLLESTRPELLKEVLAGDTNIEAEAATQLCRATGFLPLALTLLQSLLARDRRLTLSNLAKTVSTENLQAMLAATFQFSWQQVRDERARRFFLLASCFPEATPIPLWLVGLAAGLGERNQPFDPLWEINLSLQELSLLDGLADDQIRLHPLTRAFGQHVLQQAGEAGNAMQTEAVQRLIAAFEDLSLLEQRARRTSYHTCLEQLRAARDYAPLLDKPLANHLSHLEHWLDRESYPLSEDWLHETIPGLFYQQIFNRSVEAGEPLTNPQPPSCWLKQSEPTGADDPALVRIFAGHASNVNSVAFSPDGKFVLTGSRDCTARLWETSSGRVLASLEEHTDKVQSVAFSPDGSFILTGSSDNTARLWDSKTGQLHATLEGPGGIYTSILSVAFSPDGSLIVTGSSNDSVYLWEISSGRILVTFQGHTKAVGSVAFSPDGRFVLTGSYDETARLWDSKTGQLHATLDTVYDANSVAFSPDGSFILTSSDDDTARVWETSSGSPLVVMKGHTSYVQSVAFSPDGHQVLTGSTDGTARLWETSSGRVLAILEGHTGGVDCVAFSPDGRFVLTGSTDMTARLWEISKARAPATSQNHTGDIECVAFSSDGRLILTGSWDRTACLWEVSSGRILGSLQGHGGIVRSVAFSPDGNQVLTGSDSRTACLWDFSSGRTLPLEGHTHMVQSVAFSPDGRLVVTGSHDHTALVWEVSSGRILTTLQGHTADVDCVAFSPDGRFILTGGSVNYNIDSRIFQGDNTVRLWDSKTGQLHATFEGHTSGVKSVAFSPDGSLILTGSDDNYAALWETSSGRILAAIQHTDDVRYVAFSPDGQIAITCDKKGWNFFSRTNVLPGQKQQYLTLGLYITVFPVKAVHWQDSSHVLLADDGGPRRRPYIYRLSLEGQGWRESEHPSFQEFRMNYENFIREISAIPSAQTEQPADTPSHQPTKEALTAGEQTTRLEPEHPEQTWSNGP